MAWLGMMAVATSCQKEDLPCSPLPAELCCKGCKQRTGCVWGDITHPCLSLQGAGPALLIQDIWTPLLSFRNKRLRANCLAACSKMLCTTTQGRAVSHIDGSAEAAEVSLSFALFQDPQTQPPPGFCCPVCWGIASREFLSPLILLLEISSSPAWLGAVSLYGWCSAPSVLVGLFPI